jgi:hypothetical protein
MLGLAVAPAGCHHLEPASFAGGTPRFDPEAFFDGHVVAAGIVEDRSGNPTQRFTVDNVGHRTPDGLEFRQHIVMEDGTVEDRTWHVRRRDEHRWEATADGVIGTAQGEGYGNVFRIAYDLALKPGNPLENVHFRQWMYLQEGGAAMVNRTVITKLGVTVAELTEYFHRVP